jgi:hypothetical protein
MTLCPYCAQPATMRIVAQPERVCVEHAMEFWTGLLAYAKDRSGPCVKGEQWCGCRSCEELAESYVRSHAIAAAGRSPRDHEPFPLRLAS